MNKWILIVALMSQVAIADEAGDLSNAVDQIGVDAAGVTTLAGKYRMTNAEACPLLVMGTSSSNSAPIYFIPGATPIAGLQADVIVGPGITITQIVAGPEATSAGKSIVSAPTPGGQRFLITGFNQNEIVSGAVAIVSFDTTAAAAGPHIFALVNFNATSPGGTDVPMCATTGVVTK